MVNILIRDVPADVHAALQSVAQANGTSLQVYLRDLLDREASLIGQRRSARQWLAELRERRLAEAAAGPETPDIDSAALIHESREERIQQILEAGNRE